MICIIGGGVAGLFTALELINNNVPGEDIIILDKGKALDKRKCFANANTPCKKCKICSVTNGLGGSGSFSDSKLNFDPKGIVGGCLYELLSTDEISTLLNEVYNIYKQFNIEEFQSKVYGKNDSESALRLKQIIDNNQDITLAECTTIHLGTDNSRIIYQRMIDYLISKGVQILSNTPLTELSKKGDKWVVNSIEVDTVVLALGRTGNRLIRGICEQHDIELLNGRVDLGVRVETLNEYMKDLNDNFYEAKLYLKGSFNDSTRVFCTNPGGVVSIESYPQNDKSVFMANGHAYANNKTKNTNFALLVSRSFNSDCSNPQDDYLFPLAQAINSLGKGQVIMQSLKDIRLNRRSTDDRIAELDIVPTVKAYAGDILSVMPYRHIVCILEALESLDKLAPGLNGDNTLLYAPEIKLHSNKVMINKYGKAKDNLYIIGDCSGYTRGLTSAASMGIMCAKDIIGSGNK